MSATVPHPASSRTDGLDSRRAWLDAAMAGLSMFVVFVTPYSFGTFVKPMADEFNANRSGIALVFGITSFLYFSLGAVTGPLVHRVGPRKIIIFGGIVQVGGILLTSKVQSLPLAYVTYGIGVGVGVACGYVPMVAVVGGWFEKKRTAAVGVAVSGIGLSSLIGSPLAARLIRNYGWRDAFVVLAVGTAVLLVVVATFIRTPPSFGVAPAHTLSSAVRTTNFAISYASVFFIAIPLFSVFVHIVPYAEDHGITKATAATVVSFVGFFSIAGRLGLAAFAQKIGIPPVYLGSFLVMTLTQFLWLTAGSSFALLAIFASLFGASYGGFISLSPGFLAEVFGADQMGGLTGINYSAAGFGALFGPTAGAWLIDRTNGYTSMIVCGLVSGAIGVALLAVLVRRTSSASPRQVQSVR